MEDCLLADFLQTSLQQRLNHIRKKRGDEGGPVDLSKKNSGGLLICQKTAANQEYGVNVFPETSGFNLLEIAGS